MGAVYQTAATGGVHRKARQRAIVVPEWWYQKYPEQRPPDGEAVTHSNPRPHYGEPPAPLPPMPPQPPKEHPEPVMSPQDAAALEILAGHQRIMESQAEPSPLYAPNETFTTPE